MKTITIKTIEEKTAKNGGKYLAIVAEEGRFSCWQAVLFQTLQDNVGKPLEVEIAKKGEYENIIGAGNLKALTPPRFVQESRDKSIREAQARKNDAILLFNSFNSAIALFPHLVEAKQLQGTQEILDFVFKLADEIYSHNEQLLK